MALKMAVIRDEAFAQYVNVKSGNLGPCEHFIRNNIPLMDQAADMLNTAFWLWVTGEYATALEDAGQRERLLQEADKAIAMAVDTLEQRWSEPRKHWLDRTNEAVYLGNLAIVYGALLAIQPHRYGERIQYTLKRMRELLFSRFIKDGRVVSVLGSKAIYGDIVLAAVPFGMLGIEDRILIEALMKVEEQLMHKGVRFSEDDTYYGGCERTDLTALLAWYYAEKGDLHRAKRLVTHADALMTSDGELPELDLSTSKEKIYHDADMQRSGGEAPTSALAATMLSIAKRTIANQGSANVGSRTASVRLIHEPTGKDDPYIHFLYERAPREPEANDRVLLRAVTEPFHEEQQVTVHLSVNGGTYEAYRMRAAQHPSEGNYWEADAGRFQAGDRVSYRFEVRVEGEQTVTEGYAFQVRKWHGLDQVLSYSSNKDNKVVLELGSIGSEVRIYAEVTADRQGVISMELLKEAKSLDLNAAVTPIADEAITLQLGSEHGALRIAAAPLRLAIQRDEEVITASYASELRPAVEVQLDADGVMCKARLHLQMSSSERLFGTGERYSRLELRGLEVDHYVYNEYRSQGMKTYMPVPFYISTQGYGLFLNTPLYSKFAFGTVSSDLLTVEVNMSAEEQSMQAFLFVGEPLDIISSFTTITGFPELPPKWSFGPWMSSNNWDSQHEVKRQVELTNHYEIPSTVIVLEQWSDEATFYIFNDAQYEAVPGDQALRYDDFTFPEWGRWPNPKQMVEELHDAGLKVLLWQIPIQKYMYGLKHEQRDADEEAMLANSYHVRQSDGSEYRIPYNWFKDCLVLDFTNEAASEWWFKKRAYLMDEIGIDGFKTDGGECIFGDDVQFADGSTGAQMRNLYPNTYVGAYYNEVQRKTGGNGITFSRAGYTGAQRFPMHWAGDERSTYEAFRSSVNAGLSCSMSGIPYWGWDLGGFHGDIPTAELFIRSTQMATFCPVMQYHAETKGEFNQDRTPWNIAERTGHPEVIGIYKQYADMRMNLLPYIYQQAEYSSKLGIPMMRAMFLVYPNDPACVTINDQYMFGDALLVAPVMEKEAFSREVYFPEGSWLSLFGQERIEGPALRTVSADLSQIPVYLKADHVIALNLAPSCQLGGHVGNRADTYQQLCLMMNITDSIDYRFADDLGTEITLQVNRENSGHRVQVDTNRSVTLMGKGFASSIKVELDGMELPRVSMPSELGDRGYCVANDELYIRVERDCELVIGE